jgi:hypothetical protein
MLTRSQLEALSAVSIRDELSADDICAALSTPPFLGGQVVTVAGEAEGGTRTTTSTSTSAATAVLNGRDLGCVPGSGLRPNLAFRCAMLRPTPETTAWLASNVKVVFDLRNHVEVQRSPDPTAEGVRNVPPVLAGTPKRIDLDKFAQGDGSEAWKETYLEILELYAPTFQAVLEHTRDSCEPFLFHCTGE